MLFLFIPDVKIRNPIFMKIYSNNGRDVSDLNVVVGEDAGRN